MNTPFTTRTFRAICATLLLIFGLQVLSPAMPVLAAPANAPFSGVISADSTANLVKVQTSAPEVYFQNGEGASPRVNITLKVKNGTVTIKGYDLSKGFQLKNVNMTSQSAAWMPLDGDSTWAIQTGADIITTAGDTVVQTGEFAVSGDAKGTSILPALTGTYATLTDEINAAISAGCTNTSGMCYRKSQDGNYIFVGSTDFVDHMVQEASLLEEMRAGKKIYFHNTRPVYAEAVKFKISDLQSDIWASYLLATRVRIGVGYFSFQNEDNQYNPGVRIAADSQLNWLNSTDNVFIPEFYVDFFTNHGMTRYGAFTEDTVVVITVTENACANYGWIRWFFTCAIPDAWHWLVW